MAERRNSSKKPAQTTQEKNNFSRLYRSEKNKMIAGVAGGIGEFFGVDPSLIRLLFVIITLLGGSGILLYIVLWIILPTESDVKKGTTEEHIKANVEEIRNKAEKFASGVRDTRGSSDNRAWWGLIIVIIGAFFLFSNLGFLGFLDWGRFWPLILIVFGIFLLTKSR
jgi:phage shock protein PspC (stress-responsive transcriptional regulator)